MKKNHDMTRRAADMLRMFWRTLKQVPFISMVRTDAPSQRPTVTASDWYGSAPLWSGCQAVIGRSAAEGLC